MQLFYSTALDTEQKTGYLSEEDSCHCIKVLRKKLGDEIQITDGLGNLVTGIVNSLDTKKTYFTIRSGELIEPNYSQNLSIAIALTKNADRIEWFVEKATEIGIGNIYPLLTERTERVKLKLERLQKIALSAMKQSKQFYLPVIHEAIKLKDLLQQSSDNERFVAHCGDVESHLLPLLSPEKKTLVLIGPEGDFTGNEIATLLEHKFKEVNLGPTRLRTETAGVTAAFIFQIAGLKK